MKKTVLILFSLMFSCLVGCNIENDTNNVNNFNFIKTTNYKNLVDMDYDLPKMEFFVYNDDIKKTPITVNNQFKLDIKNDGFNVVLFDENDVNEVKSFDELTDTINVKRFYTGSFDCYTVNHGDIIFDDNEYVLDSRNVKVNEKEWFYYL